MVGQGLVGTVDVRTIRPLEYGRKVLAIGARGSYADLGALNALTAALRANTSLLGHKAVLYSTGPAVLREALRKARLRYRDTQIDGNTLTMTFANAEDLSEARDIISGPTSATMSVIRPMTIEKPITAYSCTLARASVAVSRA